MVVDIVIMWLIKVIMVMGIKEMLGKEWNIVKMVVNWIMLSWILVMLLLGNW